ncbi:hypothetical protein AGMMS50293_17310 [Spirochaetia bacterium]|nr:hypothetical protein AGMMS50293_17310 [Spirochaetia bacterium]
MTIVSIKIGTTGELRRVELSDGSFFSFKTCYLPPIFTNESLLTPGMAEGRELDAGEEEGFRFASACLRAEKAALRLIARAEQSVFGLSRKLERRGCTPACTRAVISRLIDLELLDDRRFARLWLETRLLRPASPRRLFGGLRARGIDHDDAESALKAVLDDETEQALLARFAAKQRRSRAFRNAETKAAEYRWGFDALRTLKFLLKSEGFSTGAIQRYFGELDEAP